MKKLYLSFIILMLQAILAGQIFSQNMSYVSSTVTQENQTSVPAGTQNAEIIGIEIVTNGSSSPLTLQKLKIHTFGTTLLSDISNAKVYYTGNNPDFDSTNQFGSTVTTPTDSFYVNGSQTLQPDTNHFWVTYDISSSAPAANFVDAKCSELLIGSTRTPSITNPFGNRPISKEITIGSGSTSSIEYGPTYFSTWSSTHYEYAIFNYLIPASQMSSSGIPYGVQITGLSFYKTNAAHITDTGDATMEIYMNTTTNTSLSGSNWSNLISAADKVHQSTWDSSSSHNLPSSSGWVNFKFDNNFKYTGQAMEVYTDYDGSELTGGYNNPYSNAVQWEYSTTTNTTTAGDASSYSKPTGTNTYYGGSVRPNMKLEYVISPAFDIAIVDFPKPGVDPCGNSSEPVSVTLKNEGGSQIDFSNKPVTINVNVSGPNPKSFSSKTINSGTLSPGDTLSVTITNNYDMSLFGTYNFSATASMNADNNTSNDQKTKIIKIQTLPSSGEDFESFPTDITKNFPNGWSAGQNTNYNWQTNQGGTSSYNTGPDNDHTLGTSNGTYVYAEGSTYGVSNPALFISPCIDMSSKTNKILQFWYHMYGSDMGSLHLDVYHNGSWQKGVKSIIGEQQSSTSDAWKNADVDLSSYSGNLRVRFRAVHGSSYQSDIAIDDISFVSMMIDAGSDLSVCGGDSVQLNPTVTGGVTPYTYTWSPSTGLDDPNTKNPKAAPSSATTYTLSVVDSIGNTDTDDVTVNVYSAPSVSFSGLGSDYCEDASSVSLSPSPSGGYFTGPGTVGYSFSPVKAGPGTHQIIYNYTNAQGCSGTDTQTVVVHPLPTVSLSGVQSDYCVDDNPDTVKVSPTGGTLSGSSLNGNVFDPTTNGPGTYTITYTYTDSWGCTNSTSKNITVHDLPAVSISNLPSDMCINDSPISLSGNPSGGTFSGTGVSSGTFDPSTAGTGTHTITYTYTDSYGCTNSTTQNVTVHDIPTVSFSGLPSSMCKNDSAVTLSGNPSGGSFSGPGISGSSFDPNAAGAGTHTITYSYTNSYGCSNNTSQTVQVYPLPSVSFTGLNAGYCITDPTVTLSGSPSGGTFSGPGISGSQFYPSVAGGGTHTITYSYTDANGCTNTAQQTTQVDNIPSVTIGSVDTDQCINGPSVTLSGSPSGGTFNGNGMSGSTFDPSSAGIGTHTIKYKYTTTYGCTDSATVDITVHNLPSVSLSGLQSSYCETDTLITLTGNPSGGTFSGPGISGNTFNPSVAGTGNHTITYSYTDSYGCSNSTTASTTVNALPSVSISGAPSSMCANDSAIILTGNPSGGSFSGPGMSGSTFDPSIAGAGNHTIIYSYTDANGCSNSDTVQITVNSLPSVSFSGLSGSYCDNDPVATLTGSPSGGSFSGPGISGNNFDPQAASAGSHTITYSYTDANGCSNSSSQNTTVYQSPNTSITGLADNYCEDASFVNLSVSPTGGTLNGPGISGTTFYPSTAGAGTHTIIYSYTNANGCVDSTIKSVTVHALPNVSISGLNSEYCIDDSTVIMSGSPSGGTFTGPGISGSNFDPSAAGAGTHTITYSYTDANGCSNTTTQSVTVHSLPTVSFSGLNSDYCVNSSAVILSGSPSGGSFSGPGMSGNTFDPSVAGAGNHTITYSYTDTYGCSNSTSSSTTVHTLPSVNFTNPPTDLCIDDSAVTLTGNPTGGNFSGPGISGSSFDPSTAGTGTHTISYTYTDGNGCSNTAQTDITVHGLPSISISGLSSQYCDNDPVASLSGNPSGGTFSGNGMSGSVFDPFAAGIGTHTISYSYTDSYGCSNSTSLNTSVVTSPNTSISGLSSDYCENDPVVNVNVSPSGGTLSGNGVSGTSFDPSAAGTGTHTIIYSYTNSNGCSDSTIQTVTIHSLPSLSISGLNSNYCINASSATLTGSPSGGSFSGPGVSGNTFDPSAAGTGTHTITYSYTDSQGCSNTISQNVTVYDLPTVSFSGLSSTYCANDPAVTLNGSPSGGTFTGPGIGGNTFDPALAGAGTHTITYSYTDSVGCTNTTSQSVTVQSVPNVYFSGLSGPYCANDPVVTLYGTPSGGSFSGPGISGNTFDPSAAGAGTHAITYTYTGSNGCSNSSTLSVTVNSLPNVSFSGLNNEYCQDSVTATLTGNPSGGTFTGDGVSGNTWNSALAGVGKDTVKYTYTNANGCSDFAKQTVTVHPLPSVSFSGLANSYCSDDSLVTLSGSPSGGTFSGSGISGNTFDPSSANTGNITISYSYTDANGCQNTDNQTTTVNAAPSVSINSMNTNFCTGDSPVALSGTPSGGTFSGTGVTGSTFDPSLAGTGTHTITYSYTASNGCSGSATINLTVNQSTPVSMSGLQEDYCLNDPQDSVSYSPSGGVLTGNGIMGDLFDPSLAGSGSHVITYTYTNSNGCVSKTYDTVEVYSLPSVSFSGLNTSYCQNEAPTTLTGSPSGGTFSGDGITGQTFDPSSTGTGMHTITYSYTDNNGCSNSSSQQVKVNTVPPLTIAGLKSDYCLNESGDSISLNPSGGSLTGNGISNNWFTPSQAGIGTHTIKYTYNFSNGCTGKDSVIVNVHDNPSVSFSGLQASYCENEAPATLTGSPSGGTFSGTGISGNTFDPAVAGAGNYTITYDYTDANGCSGAASQNVTVNNVPTVTGGKDTLLICENASPVDLTIKGNPSPTGGNYTGTGINNNIFDPAKVSSTGIYLTSYTYTTAEGCSATATSPTNSLIINMQPAASISLSGLDSSYCTNGGPDTTLSVTPSNGSFNIVGAPQSAFTGNNFYPSKAPTGNIDIEYSTTNAYGCTSRDTFTTTVHQSPVVDAGTDTSIAYNSNAILNGQASGLTGSATYSWSPASLVNNANQASTATSNLTSNQTFTLAVTDNANGCSNTDDMEVFVQGGALTINPKAYPTNNVCQGASSLFTIKANPSGGTGSYTYTWATPMNNTFTTQQIHPVDGGGYYSVTVSDGATTITDSVLINILNSPNASMTGFDSLHCVSDTDYFNVTPKGGSIFGNGVSASSSGSSDYKFVASAAGSGNHLIEYVYTNTNGCTDTASQWVNVQPEPTIQISGYDSVYCSSDLPDTLTATPSGGTFSGPGITGNAFDPQQAGAGWHVITYQYQYGSSCTTTKDISIEVNPSPSVNIANLDSTYCENDSSVMVNATPAGGTLSGPGVNGMTFNPAQAGPGTYTISYKVSSSGCPGAEYQQVTVYDVPDVSFSGLSTTYCENDNTATLSGSPAGGTFSGPGINGNTFDPKQAGAGQHTITYSVTTTTGCKADTSMNILVNSTPLADAGTDITLPCGSPGQTIGTASQPGMIYDWSPSKGLNDTNIAQPTAAPNVTTLYNLTVTDVATGCQNTDDVLVEVTGGPTASVTPEDTLICNNQPLTLSASGGNSYSWSNGATGPAITVNPSTDTNYTVTVSQGLCGSIDTAFVKIDEVNLNIPSTFKLCEGDSVTIDAGQFDSYLWSTSDSSSTLKTDTAGTYWVKVTDSLGCSATDTFDVNKYPSPSVDLGNDTTINQKATLTLDAGSGFEAYQWNTGNTYQTIQIKGINYNPGSYPFWVRVTNQNLCTNTDTITVTIVDESGIEEKLGSGLVKLYPNPNNGQFKLEGENIHQKLNIRIMSANGSLIYNEDIQSEENFTKNFDMPQLERGVYFMNIESESDSKTIKFIIN